MRITEILEQPVGLHGDPANALVNFTTHTVSLVAVSTT
jgi:D(-)-tartrate dehydratase